MGHVQVTDQLQWVRWLTTGFPEYELPPLALDAACAVTGNYSWENNALPVTIGAKDHGSDGGAQWRLDRLEPDTIPTSLKGWCASHIDSETGQPLNWKTIKAQSAFTIWELRTKYFKLYSDMQYGHKSLATQTANFMEVYEVPAPATANLDARIKFAEQTLAAWNAIPAPTPVPAPATAPVPAPTVPYPLPPAPIPAQIPSLPPVAAAGAGRLAAVLDQLNAIHAKYVADRAAADAEDAILVAAITQLSGIGPTPAALAPPAIAASPALQPKGILSVNNTVLPANWQTTALGASALLGAAAAVLHSVSTGQMPDITQLGILWAAISTGIGLIKAKDANVTGGTVPATLEAAARVSK